VQGREEKREGRRRRQGQKWHYATLLSPTKSKMNILIGTVSINKFDKKI
jgi:hypothetical protein